MEAEPWDRAEDLFIRQRLKERCYPQEIAERMSRLGYRRTIEAVAKRAYQIKGVLEAQARGASTAAAVRKEDDPSPELQRQNQAFLKAMVCADLD
jgi:hypothetical protein